MKRRILLLAFIVVFAAAGVLLWAQEPAATPAPAQAQGAQDESVNMQAGGRQLAEASNEAAGESGGENDKFKFSKSVQGLAHFTHLSVRQAYWISVVFNFVVVGFLIAWLMKLKLPSWFGTRTETIQKGMKEARAASEDARQRLSDVESRLARLDADIAELRAASEKEALAEEQRIRSSAEEDARKVMQSAEQEIEAAARQARRELKTLAAQLAVEIAAKKLYIDPATDQVLVRDFVQQLGKDGK